MAEKVFILKDGRMFKGTVAFEIEEELELEWTDRGVQHWVSIRRDQVRSEFSENGPNPVRTGLGWKTETEEDGLVELARVRAEFRDGK